MGTSLSSIEGNALQQAITYDREFFSKTVNHLELTERMTTLLRENFDQNIVSTILQRAPNYSQLGPLIETAKKNVL